MNVIARLSPKPETTADFESQLALFDNDIASVLPPNVTLERFKQVALTAIGKTAGDPRSDLLAANRPSLLAACVEAARSGLQPDGKEGAFVIMGGRVQWMPMVQGILKLMRNSGLLASISVNAAYEGETFRVLLGSDMRIEHEWDGEAVAGGKVKAAYAIARLRNPADGTPVEPPEIVVMSRSEIEKVRKASRSPDKGPWKDWYAEMAKKSVLHRFGKTLPKDAEPKVVGAIASVERMYHFPSDKEQKIAEERAQIEYAAQKAGLPVGDLAEETPRSGGRTIDHDEAAQPETPRPIVYVKSDGGHITCATVQEWKNAWIGQIGEWVRDQMFADLRSAWDRNRDSIRDVRSIFPAEADAVEGEIRNALGIDAPPGEYKPAETTATDRPLEDSMPGGNSGVPQTGAAEGFPYLDEYCKPRSAPTTKGWGQQINKVLGVFGEDLRRLSNYQEQMQHILKSMHEGGYVKAVASARKLIADAIERARTAERNSDLD